jgi:hypothetical protein
MDFIITPFFRTRFSSALETSNFLTIFNDLLILSKNKKLPLPEIKKEDHFHHGWIEFIHVPNFPSFHQQVSLFHKEVCGGAILDYDLYVEIVEKRDDREIDCIDAEFDDYPSFDEKMDMYKMAGIDG